MAPYDDYESCLRFLETVPEEMQVPERSAARPRADLAGKGVLQSYNHDDSDDEVSSQELNFRTQDSSDYGSPKESIFSACSSPKMPSLSLHQEEVQDEDLDLFLGELDEVEIHEITNVLTYVKGEVPRLK
ncbi:hypothetical protein FT663_00728 [Candidozyma haemuli var. vulneris]|uniref:Uncharacterized protein n=1 Tax=Candidozyma haemuli TaxID=45357 RepID=A0A2V1APL1_9ASCO|nr:hypothetical protein CXQ85_003677 [[Candida] haemuloni]KAF3992448.1 hypothetical protein FT662_01157 [[Candida] haemuloni var. vulneris]KAF3995185.1 hypothetical protein FT663_00728 [[Candida] haemuloni var. vulneris]PVH19819.1 hypothetical protein CXQ85_003677 [[Candida] haemuloni]